MINKFHQINFLFNTDEAKTNLISENEIEYINDQSCIHASKEWNYDWNVCESLSIISDINESALQNTKIFRYPNISLPRTKMDSLKNKLNVKIIRDTKDADYCIVSKTYLNSIPKRKWSRVINKTELKRFYDIHSSYFTKDAEIKFNTFFDAINVNDIINIEVIKFYNSNMSFGKKRINEFIEDLDHLYVTFIPIESSENFQFLLNSKNLIYDNTINNIANSESHILSESDYDSLLQMILNKDDDNVSLALEILANCNINKSIDIVALLLYFNIEKLKLSKNWNLINVKTMRNMMSEFIVSHSHAYIHGYNYFIEKLSERNELTEFAFKKSVSILFDNIINKALKQNNETEKIFTIDIESIKLSDKYKSKLKVKNEI